MNNTETMTNDFAKIVLVQLNTDEQLNVRAHEAIRVAIKVLEQQTCEDAVSREAVLGLFAQNADAVRPYSKTWEEVKALPPVNPQRTGHWIESKGYDDRDHFYICSECGRYINLNCGAKLTDYPYCHCGAKMTEGSEKE